MLDDLRNSAAGSFKDEEEAEALAAELERERREARKRQPPFLGLTAAQRFVIVLMLFLTVLIVGSLILILTEKVYLPFF